jgi:thiol-disulfide isomerase/thioredoxin
MGSAIKNVATRGLCRALAATALSMLALAGANPAAAEGAAAPRDRAALAALATGDMRKLVLHDAPRPVSDVAFSDPAGASYRLSDWQGRVVLVNFWATWCAPCRKEMPALDRLEAALGGERFAVVTIATGRNAVPSIERFFAEQGIARLPVLLDPRSALARDMAVLGLPVSVILDASGHEIARLTGDAEWDSPAALALFAALGAAAP